MAKKLTAIEIDSPKVWDIICAIDPTIKELSFEENLHNLFVLDFGGSRWALMSPETARRELEIIEPGVKIKTLLVTVTR